MMVAMVATAFAITSCNGPAKKDNANVDLSIPEGEAIDSLSYALGANMGLSVNFTFGEEVLNPETTKQNLLDFYANGDEKSEEFMEGNMRFNQFQMKRLRPYMIAQYQIKSITESTEGQEIEGIELPEVPVLYDEEFSKEDISAIIGKQMGASLKQSDAIKINWAMKAFEDALAVESEEKIDEQLSMTLQQMQKFMTEYQIMLRKKAMEEYEKSLTENDTRSKEWLAEVEQMEGVQKTESGILYRIDREGNGDYATVDTDVVKVNYEGKTSDGNVFDSSYERGEAISFPLNRVIKGWTEGMKLINEGGQITLWIPSELAYGVNAPASIGPNQALEFKVELLEVNPEE
jgi:FKBP-type peptidyl-prolyl cis-trans isomerase